MIFLLKMFRSSGALWRGTGAVSRAGGPYPEQVPWDRGPCAGLMHLIY